MKGLLIAYSFSPNKGVGALRPTYWAEEAVNIENFSLDVVTATPSDVETSYAKKNVANVSKSIWSFLIKDEGLTWKKDLQKYFNSINVNQYDFVLFTGGPFFHFSLGKFFKKKGVKVIYDYRDPYSYNPRHNDKGLKRVIKSWFENANLKQADLVITVNDACHDYIGAKLKLNRGIIPNGYDERIIPSTKLTESKFDLFYAGRFYWEPIDFFDAIKEDEISLAHAGIPQDYKHPFIQSELFSKLGMLSQKEMYLELMKAEIGVIFTINVPFESTTKLYDYLALNKKILIITQGEPNEGALKRELTDYPNYRWVRNNKAEISKAIIELKAEKSKDIDVSRFARKEGLNKLVLLIKELMNE